MHEMGMCEGVLAAVEQRAGGREVARVGVRAGTLLRVEPAAFQASFELVAAGSVAERATTEITITPVRARCTGCEVDFDTLDPFPACPECGGVDLQREGGEELVLERVRYVDHPAPAREGAVGAADADPTPAPPAGDATGR